MKTLTICFIILFLISIGSGQDNSLSKKFFSETRHSMDKSFNDRTNFSEIGNLKNDYHENTYLLSENGYLLIEMLGYEWDGAQWMKSDKDTYDYDEKGNNTEFNRYRWEGDDWVLGVYGIYTYDIDGKLIEEIFNHWSLTKSIYGYNEDGNLSVRLHYPWDGAIWVIRRMDTYSYDENGNNIERLEQEWDGENWVNDYKYTYDYDAKNQLIENISQGVEDGEFVNSGKSIYSYDENGNNIERLKQEWDGENWVNTYKYTYDYDTDGNNIEMSIQDWDVAQWITHFKLTYDYNTDGNKIEEFLQNWEGENWVNNKKTTYDYNTDGNHIESFGQNWEGGQWVNDYKYISIWEQITTIPEQNINANIFRLSQNYPNPFNPSTTIEYDLPNSSDVKIEVYNIAGQKVQTLLNTKMSAGSHRVEFNAQNLSSGIYYYRIEAGEFQDVKKMILLR